MTRLHRCIHVQPTRGCRHILPLQWRSLSCMESCHSWACCPQRSPSSRPSCFPGHSCFFDVVRLVVSTPRFAHKFDNNQLSIDRDDGNNKPIDDNNQQAFVLRFKALHLFDAVALLLRTSKVRWARRRTTLRIRTKLAGTAPKWFSQAHPVFDSRTGDSGLIPPTHSCCQTQDVLD